MSKPAPAYTEPVVRHLAGRDRVLNAATGIVPAAIALPLVLRSWAPTWFVVAWLVTYVAMSSLFVGLIITRHSSRVEQAWSISAALVFCGLPISSVIWSGEPEAFYAAATVGIIFIAFEMAALPFLEIGEWRTGVYLVGITLTVCGFFVVHPIVAFALAPVVYAIVSAADRMRQLKIELEDLLSAARRTIQHDALTGLLNRRGLATLVDTLDGQDVTVALVDVDRFKLINDTHGHQVGDQVLTALAHELTTRFGNTFSLARLGGDEFVAVAPGRVPLDSDLAQPAQITIELHKQPFSIECGLSIGVSHGVCVDSAQRLLSEAGFAMRDSKQSGSTLARFGTDLADRLDRTLQVAAIAGGSTAHGTFVPVAQAVMSDERVVGCELLIRWQRRNGELLEPAQFLPLAVEAGLMGAINDLMLEHAVRFAARFNNRPNAPFVAVNVSAPHLGEIGFRAGVQSLLAEHRVPPERLMIEITESEQLAGYGGWETAAAELRALGVNLAIDDFGTGYSSIERLQHLPISHLKFDRTLVKSVSGPFGEIAGGVARFARALNIGIIAEGIETLDELESMRAFDISMFQGFHFHRPEPLDVVEQMVIHDRTRTPAR